MITLKNTKESSTTKLLALITDCSKDRGYRFDIYKINCLPISEQGEAENRNEMCNTTSVLASMRRTCNLGHLNSQSPV